MKMSGRPHRLRTLGMVNCLGRSTTAIRDRMLRGDRRGFTQREDLVPGRTVWVGAVQEALEPVPAQWQAFASPTGQLVLEAYRQIADQVAGCAAVYGFDRIGIVLGSSTSGIAVGEGAVLYHHDHGCFPAGYHYSQQEPGAAGELLAQASVIRGPAFTVSTACSSGAKALASAANLLDLGICDAVIAGGADALCRMTLNGFSVLELISDFICDPMSGARAGITIGEGACLFLMTAEPGGIQLLGVGESSDAYHMSAPDPEGRGAELAMRGALEAAGLTADDICYINLHGTGTVQNDLMESKAVARIFPPHTPCSSSKGQIGHTLGAAGAIEAGFCWLALDAAADDVPLPPHCWSGTPDASLAPLALVASGQRIPRRNVTAMLSNSFAFGGSNCSVIIGKEKST